MATGGSSGRFLEVLEGGQRGTPRLGQAFVLFGLLSVVAGVGLFVLTGTFQFHPDAVRTYRRVAVSAAGYGLPAFLLGVVVVTGGERWGIVAALVGGLLSTFAVVLFLTAYFGPWEVFAAPVYVEASIAVYALGTVLGVVGGGGSILLEVDPDPDPDPDAGRDGREIEIGAESEFIWGEPPEE
jgi:hypothetical protein